jgi:outer membrane protein assembly factor BamE
MRLFPAGATSLAILSLTGCLGGGNMSDPVTDTLAQTPFMYKPDIQQGNVITQQQVNRLEPGMSMEQVRYLLGTPLLQSTFHENRWDYVYTMKRGGDKVEKKRIALFFKDGQLNAIEGDYRPDPNGIEDTQETVVTVPDQEAPGFIDNTMKSIGLGDDTPASPPQEKAPAAAPPSNGQDRPNPATAPASTE